MYLQKLLCCISSLTTYKKHAHPSGGSNAEVVAAAMAAEAVAGAMVVADAMVVDADAVARQLVAAAVAA